jgi:ABC-type multidrug transport system permease subunit
LQVVIELPYTLVQATVYGVIVYSMIGFEWTAPKFFWYLFFMYFTLLYFTFYGMMVVGLTPHYHIASIVSSFFYAIWNLFSGFIIPRPVGFITFGSLYLLFFKHFIAEVFSLLTETMYRKSPSGGDGIAGYARSHGHSTGW